MKKFLITLSLIVYSIFLVAQNGTIRGEVFDATTGEGLIGAGVRVAETNGGTLTDIEGNFSVKVAPGVYTVIVSYYGYNKTTINNVEVKDDEVTLLKNIKLKEAIIEKDEFVVEEKALRSSTTALITQKRNSTVILDGISSSTMKLVGSSDAVEAAQRVTGVSVEGGKYVYIRGLGDRYTKTTLNGAEIPGLDPDRNTIQMDIFPTSIIDNIVVSKVFTADQPADFTGGLLNIETKDFPEEEILSVSLGVGYNPSMHFNNSYLTNKGGSTDFLGFDDGAHKIPSIGESSNFPFRNREATLAFDPNLAVNKTNSFMNGNFSVTYGDQKQIGEEEKNRSIGYIFSLSYKYSQDFYEDVIYGDYVRYQDPQRTDLLYKNTIEGSYGESSALVSILGGIAYKSNNSKYRFNVLRLQNATSKAGQFSIDNNSAAPGASGYIAQSDNLEYNQRSLTNILLSGKHLLKDNSWTVEWKASPTLSTSDDPDIRKTAFSINNQGEYIINPGEAGNPSRLWRYLDEINFVTKVDVTKEFKYKDRKAKLKFGLSNIYKDRDYEILAFDLASSGQVSLESYDPNVLLNPNRVVPFGPNKSFYQSGNADPNPNEYQANANNTGAYISTELLLTDQLKTVVGVRMENYVQRHTGRSQTASSNPEQNLDNEKVLESVDLFPSLNFIYSLNENTNLRLVYYKTIARPSFKELSFAQILDPFTGRTFSGGLFPVDNWNGNLTETRINNFDLRYEIYGQGNELVSVSGFVKLFNDPIEMVRISTSITGSDFQPRNVADGTVYGLEFEVRKQLNFIENVVPNLSVSGNLTVLHSQIKMSKQEYDARKLFEKEGNPIQETRQMAGQSPFVLNLGLVYEDYEDGVSAGLFYNVKGPTLESVGVGIFPDVYTMPFHSLNASVSKKLGKDQRTNLSFRIANLLNATKKSSFVSQPNFEFGGLFENIANTFTGDYGDDTGVFSQVKPSVAFSLSISHNF